MNATIVLNDETCARRLWAVLRNNWVAMAQQGRPLAVTVSEHRAKRTYDQNAKLHAMIGQLAREAVVQGEAYSAEAWKEHIRRQFLGTEDMELPDGTVVQVGRSTTRLTVTEMSDLIERVHQWAAEELGVELL